LRAEAAPCQPIATAGPCGVRGTTEVAREKNEGLEWNVRKELVPGFCPKPVATGLGLRQDEPQVEREALEERVPIQTRDAPDGSGGGGTGQGEAFWLDTHVQYLPKPYQFAV
jgi:hypothetical protein